MIYAVYDTYGGALVSSTTDAAQLPPAEVLVARGYAVAERPDGENVGGVWVPADLRWVPRQTVTRVLTPLQFRDLFTMDEEIAVTAAAQQSVAVRVWLDRLNVAQEIDLDDARTRAGVEALEAAGLIGPGRAAEILG